jgi:hypothetical protein
LPLVSEVQGNSWEIIIGGDFNTTPHHIDQGSH